MKSGEFLENIRFNQKLTLREFSEKNKIDVSLLSKIERNRIIVDEELKAKIIEVYQISNDHLNGLDFSYIEYTEEEQVGKLPIFIKKSLTNSQADELIEIIKKA